MTEAEAALLDGGPNEPPKPDPHPAWGTLFLVVIGGLLSWWLL
jgi:hypothetical protein